MFRYPNRLAHRTPAWVERAATYHIRVSLDLNHTRLLTEPTVATTLLDSARFYHEQDRRNCRFFLIMPDHIHALLVFPNDKDMGTIVAAWKGYQAKCLAIPWQGNYFDHRIRSRDELEEKVAYIRMNPVRKNLCSREDAWPWVLSCVSENPSGGRVPP